MKTMFTGWKQRINAGFLTVLAALMPVLPAPGQDAGSVELPPVSPDAPTTPLLTSAAALSDTEVVLKWNASTSTKVASNQIRYYIWQSSDASTGFNHLPADFVTDAGATEFRITGLQPSSRSFYAVRAWIGGYNFSGSSLVRQIDMPGSLYIHLPEKQTGVRPGDELRFSGNIPEGTPKAGRILFLNAAGAVIGSVNVDLTAAWEVPPLDAAVRALRLEVTLDEKNGSRTVQSLPVLYGGTPPQIQITAPTTAATTQTEEDTIILSGTASDDQALESIQWSHSNGASGVCTGTTSWHTGSIPVLEGGNVLRVIARDAIGTAEATLTVTRPDRTAPIQIDTLRLEAPESTDATSLQAMWRAPADAGTATKVASYEIRHSNAILTPANWDSASLVTDVPVPGNPGTEELLFIRNLRPDTQYCVAIRSRDLAGNVSPISNYAVAKTHRDTTPPTSDGAQVLIIDPSRGTKITEQSSTDQITLHRDGFFDPETGVTAFRYALYTDEEPPTLILSLGEFPFKSARQTLSTSLEIGRRYRVGVVALNATGLASTEVLSDAVRIIASKTPDTLILKQPMNPTNLIEALFEFEAPGSSANFEYAFDGGNWIATSEKTLLLSKLSEGAHHFQVRAVLAGDIDPTPAEARWSIDTHAPETTITATPWKSTQERTAAFSFSSLEKESSFEYSLDGGSWIGTSDRLTLSDLAIGTRTLRARAVDPAGNTDASPAEFTWQILPVSPVIELPQDQITLKTTDTLKFQAVLPTANMLVRAVIRLRLADGTTIDMPLDVLVEGETISGEIAVSKLDSRALSAAIILVLLDASGNEIESGSDPVRIERDRPTLTLTLAPESSSRSQNATFVAESSDAGGLIRVRLDGGSWSDRKNGESIRLLSLLEGLHTAEFVAVDSTGNSSDVIEHTWIIEPDLASLTEASINTKGMPAYRTGHTFVSTGDYVVVWGGKTFSGVTWDGARYDLKNGTWLSMSTTGAPLPRSGHVSKVENGRVIVTGGYDAFGRYLSDGGMYDPLNDTWTSYVPAELDVLERDARTIEVAFRSGDSKTATERRLVILDAPGAIYDLDRDTSIPLSEDGAPKFDTETRTVAAGRRIIVLSGTDLAVLDPFENTWSRPKNLTLPAIDPKAAALAWTGEALWIWNGKDCTAFVQAMDTDLTPTLDADP